MRHLEIVSIMGLLLSIIGAVLNNPAMAAREGELSFVTQITDAPYSASIPSIGGNFQMAWSASDGNGDNEIFYTDETTIYQLTNNEASDVSPRINNQGQIVWRTSDGHDLMFYDGAEIIELSSSTRDDYQLNNVGQVAWTSSGGQSGCLGSNVFFYNGEEVKRITCGSSNLSVKRINDRGHIVWSSTDGQIYFYDGETTKQITDYDGAKSDITMNNNGSIVWSGVNPDPTSMHVEIMLYNGREIVAITTNNRSPSRPSINDKNQIVWEASDDNDREIYFYDGRNTWRRTTNATNDNFPTINNLSDITWRNTDYDGDYEIMVFSEGHTYSLTDNAYHDVDSSINDFGQIVFRGHDGDHYQIFFTQIFMSYKKHHELVQEERSKWDIGDDHRIGLGEAINALKIVSGGH